MCNIKKLPSPFSNLLDSSPWIKSAMSGNWTKEKWHNYNATCGPILAGFTKTCPYLSANIMPDHLLNHHISERLEVLDELLVLVISGLFLHKELEEGSLLPADPSHVSSLFSHLEQQPQQISHAWTEKEEQRVQWNRPKEGKCVYECGREKEMRAVTACTLG